MFGVPVIPLTPTTQALHSSMLARMELTYLYALISVVGVSLVALVGIFAISIKERLLQSWLFALVSLAVGALLGDAFIHLIPEAFEEAEPLTVSLSIIGGVLLFFVIEKALHWHHHQGLEDEDHAGKPLGGLILISDAFHNFIDGIIIASSYFVSVEAGIATTVAVILHEIPQEIGDFGVLVHAGYSKAKALWYNFFSGLSAVAGAFAAFLLGSTVGNVTTWLVPIAAGGFIYIALSDLIPELHGHENKTIRHSVLQFLWMVIGILAMVLLLQLEG